MKYKLLEKKQYPIFALIILISLVLSILFYNKLGAKDAAVFFVGTVLLLVEIYVMKLDRKLSVLVFIVSLPIIVTARKVCYFNILIFRVTYETIYITLLFLASYKDIKGLIRQYLINKDTKTFKLIMLLIMFMVFSYNSSIYSHNIYESVTENYISVVIPIMFMLAVVANFQYDNIKKIYFALIISIDLSCIYGFLQIYMNGITFSTIKSSRELLTFGYHNINIFASILMMIMPFLLQLILYSKNNKVEKLILTISLIVNLSALFITYTRGAWLSFIILVFLILLSRKYKKLIFILFLLFIAVSKPLISYILKRGTNTDILSNESAIARIQSIFTSFTTMFDYPFGTGAKTFATIYKEYLDAGYMIMPESLRYKIKVANYALENAHNLWLQIGVELGIVCLIVFILIMINIFRTAFINYRLNRANIGSLVMFLAFSVLTGFEFNHKGVITNNLILWLVFAMIQINSRFVDNDFNNA
jgi:O-antigen ligase